MWWASAWWELALFDEAVLGLMNVVVEAGHNPAPPPPRIAPSDSFPAGSSWLWPLPGRCWPLWAVLGRPRPRRRPGKPEGRLPPPARRKQKERPRRVCLVAVWTSKLRGKAVSPTKAPLRKTEGRARTGPPTRGDGSSRFAGRQYLHHGSA